jgi:hypothetical protein
MSARKSLASARLVKVGEGSGDSRIRKGRESPQGFRDGLRESAKVHESA